FTAFYMFRLYFMTFRGSYRGAEVDEGIIESEPEHAGHRLIPDQRHLDEGDEHTDKAHGHHIHAHPHEPPEPQWSLTGVPAVSAAFAACWRASTTSASSTPRPSSASPCPWRTSCRGSPRTSSTAW